MLEWRWDQGRVLYFQFDVIKEMAKVLVKFENKNINEDSIDREFRSSLEENVGMPFAPMHYKVNRNYSRVFQCAMLARNEGKALVVSDLCKLLAKDDSLIAHCDDYLYEIVRRFRYPYPAFQEYDAREPRVYPFCAVLKYLISQKELGNEAKVNLKDICNKIIGNSCTGTEDIDFYKQLKPTSYMVAGDGVRQLREMIAFISQLSFLKVFSGNLYLDVNENEDVQDIINHVLEPYVAKPLPDRTEEFCQLTKVSNRLILPIDSEVCNVARTPLNVPDMEFVEGKKVRVQHLRIERSPLLRKFYIATHPEPVCAACETHIQKKYPWVDYMLDLHHLLPLSSVIRISSEGTSLDDMVGLCPSCHRAIHTYYRKWLKSNCQDDFRSKQEAMSVYLEAVKEIA